MILVNKGSSQSKSSRQPAIKGSVRSRYGQAFRGDPAPRVGGDFANCLHISYGLSVQRQQNVVTMTSQTTPIGVRINLETKEALGRAAKDDRRSLASMTDKILTDWLKAKGYLQHPAGRGEVGNERF